MKTLYACIWKSHQTDDSFDLSEFESRLPRLMDWLRSMKAGGHLVACGGGGFENHSGGLTILSADSVEHAVELSNGTPMNEIGTTEIFVWDNFYGDLQNFEHAEMLVRK